MKIFCSLLALPLAIPTVVSAVSTAWIFPSPLGTDIHHLSATQNSPDQPVSPASFTIKTTDGKCEIIIDSTAAPDLADWAGHQLAPVLAGWYPEIVALLPSPGFTAPTSFRVTIRPMDGVAYTTGTDVFVSDKWIRNEIGREAIGSLVHELVHVVQQYSKGDNPGWLVEGMADYIRWFKYEPQSHGADIVWMRHLGKKFTPRYNASYRITANFLNWVTVKYDPGLVSQLNAAMRGGEYSGDFWKAHTGKTVEELGAEWKEEIGRQLHS